MIIKRILSWSVWMVMACIATAPVAGAEQPIIVPVILIVSQNSDRSNVTAPPKLQTAVYRIRAAGKQPSAKVPNLPEDSGTARTMRNEVRLEDCTVRRVDFVSLNPGVSNASGSTELSLPVLLKVVINGREATDVSISCALQEPDRQWTEWREPVIPATDLLTGRSTTVRPEYMEEYHRMVGSNSR